MIASTPDLLRLPLLILFIWVSISDIRTRRVPGWVWYPGVAIGLLALTIAAWDAWQIGGFVWRFLLQTVLSVGIVAPLGVLFYRFGAFGLADAKALVVLAIAFPTVPTIAIGQWVLPLVEPAAGLFSLAILTNGVLIGLAYPVGLACYNLVRGEIHVSMFVGRPVATASVTGRHGRLLEGQDGMTTNGLDLDALRLYLRWRDLDLAELRADPDRFRTSEGIPPAGEISGDGGIRADGGAVDDPWGAATFVDGSDGIYGTRPEQLRSALEILATRDRVWVSPGIPFLVPLTIGLLIALTYGDLLTAAMRVVGLV